MAVVEQAPIETTVQTFALEDANVALDHLRHGQIRGAAVLKIGA
jgi:alcohol dehydrogenase, propanol-preferring